MNAPRFFARLSQVLLVLVFCLTASGIAFAQSSQLSQAVSLSKSAMEDYDFFELESADTKLIQAVQIIENLGVTDPGVANIYVAQGIVSYGRFKDSAPAIADERAFSAFLKALALNPDVMIPKDYRSDEIEAIIERARQTIKSVPSSSPIAMAAVKPTVEHTAYSVSDRCRAIDIRAKVPAHPDIYRVYLHYASDNQRGYTSAEMQPSGSADTLMATIPGLSTQDDSVHYYIEALNRQGEVVAGVASAQVPLTTMMTGECVGLSREELAESYGEPVFQLNVLAGTGLGIVKGSLVNELDGNKPTQLNTGVASVPFHLRFGLLFNLPANIQLGVYVRGQLVSIVSDKNLIYGKEKYSNPAVYNVLVGATLRYMAVNKQPYRFYVGVEVGWGGASASIFLKNNKIGLYLFDGPIHIAPEVGFLWSFHKNVGLAVELAVPIYFPNRPTAHFDLSFGPYFQF